MEDRFVLCGADKEKQKYYFNPYFALLPEEVKDELQIMVVLFVQEVGGALVLRFEEDGRLLLETSANQDVGYDEIGAALKIKELQRNQQDFLEQLEMFYQVFVQGEL